MRARGRFEAGDDERGMAAVLVARAYLDLARSDPARTEGLEEPSR